MYSVILASHHPVSKELLKQSAYYHEFADSAQWLRTWSLEANASGSDDSPAPDCSLMWVCYFSSAPPLKRVRTVPTGECGAGEILAKGRRVSPGECSVKFQVEGNLECFFHRGLEGTASWEVRCRNFVRRTSNFPG